MTSRHIMNILRWVFLSVCLGAVATRVAWVRHGDFIDDVDWSIRDRTQRAERATLIEVKELVKSGDSATAIERLTEQATNLRSVQHGDRLEAARIETLEILVDQTRQEERLEEAIAWSQELHELNPRWVPNEVVLASLLNDVGEREAALSVLGPIRALAPLSAADVQMKVLVETLRAGAFQTGLEQLLTMEGVGPVQIPLGPWELRVRGSDEVWTPGHRFDMTHAGAGDSAPGAYRLNARLDLVNHETGEAVSGVQTVRLDAPRGSAFEARDLKCVFSAAASPATETVGSDQMTRVHHLELEGDVLRADGRIDPYFWLPVTMEGAMAIEVSMDLSLLFPAELHELLTSRGATEAREALLSDLSSGFASGDRDAEDRLNRIKLLGAMLDG